MKKILASLAVGFTPILSLAATSSYSPSMGILGLFSFASQILSLLVPLAISVAVVWFIFQVIKYTIASDEDKKTAARNQMIWGIIGIFVMVSVWGLVAILQSTFGMNNVSSQIGNLIPVIR
ncbi:MAG: pilin [Candidatus Pacebacteria bacterium]|nr:pilin [Candidatus Paceibacterota bacterium]